MGLGLGLELGLGLGLAKVAAHQLAEVVAVGLLEEVEVLIELEVC